ncbi:hypothetical protein BR93DRAFT_81998 [Coniochaeta sp. PMI_546]|nr:hypothetical protein BR93DRAFT_81998 [Coniochaeta sp. PMI_546]
MPEEASSSSSSSTWLFRLTRRIIWPLSGLIAQVVLPAAASWLILSIVAGQWAVLAVHQSHCVLCRGQPSAFTSLVSRTELLTMLARSEAISSSLKGKLYTLLEPSYLICAHRQL